MTERLTDAEMAKQLAYMDQGLHDSDQARMVRQLQAEIAALRADNASLAARGIPWRAWETAPENGDVILAWRPDAGVFTAHYVEEDAHLSNAMNPPEGDFFWFSTSGEDLTGDLPLVWMPLPEPPVTP